MTEFNDFLSFDRNLEEQDEATNLKHAQGVADGKARANAKGLGDFDDQDFDDDNWGMSKHKAKPRADNSTLAAIGSFFLICYT